MAETVTGNIDAQMLMRLLTEEGLPLHGFCPFAAVAGHLLPCRAAARLPKAPRTVITALFPYRYPDTGGRNLSRYACVPDYHTAAGAVLRLAAARLREEYPPFCFEPFIDSSPIPEVRAAALAGLGCVGDNGLLIHPRFGSWVFIGTIVTDAKIAGVPGTGAACAAGMPTDCPEPPACLHCGACARACPAGCIGGGREGCLSAVTQRKGELSAGEREMIREGGLAWGCDRCQEVCPLNRGADIAPHPCLSPYEPLLTSDELAGDLAGRAYGWRGRAVPLRNLQLLTASDEERNP